MQLRIVVKSIRHSINLRSRERVNLPKDFGKPDSLVETATLRKSGDIGVDHARVLDEQLRQFYWGTLPITGERLELADKTIGIPRPRAKPTS